mgnify:CR=1 FL=1
MKLSTGKIALPLQFDNGDVENIFINPHDAGLQDRIKGFETSIHERLKKINLGINFNIKKIVVSLCWPSTTIILPCPSFFVSKAIG